MVHQNNELHFFFRCDISNSNRFPSMRGSPELLRSGSPATINLLIYYSINTRLPLLCRNTVRAKTLQHVLTTRMIILLYMHTVCCRRSSSLAFALQPGVIPVTRTYRGLLLLLFLLLFYRTLTDPVRILPWSQERRSQTGKTVVGQNKNRKNTDDARKRTRKPAAAENIVARKGQ